MTEAYPLQRPDHIERTAAHRRSHGSFQVTPHQAAVELSDEVRRSGGTHMVISSNVPVRRDGLPYANHRKPDDPGVAVYYMRKGQQICIPCDAFDATWKNVRAIGLSIRDMRGPESRGCAAITDQAFSGFIALPAPDAVKQWWDVLQVPRTAHRDDVEHAWKRLRKDRHPDTPSGSTAAFQELQAAYEQGVAGTAGAND